MKHRTDDNLKERRRELRRIMTEAEKLLWIKLRDRRYIASKFRRQHPVLGRFILDFYCPEKRLAIELDGFVHEGREAIDEDRQSLIEESGIKVIRFKNEEVRYNIDGVLEMIKEALDETPSPNPLPLNGRGDEKISLRQPLPFSLSEGEGGSKSRMREHDKKFALRHPLSFSLSEGEGGRRPDEGASPRTPRERGKIAK